MSKVWNWWLANAGHFMVVCVAALYLAIALDQSWLVMLIGVVGFASLVQGLRNLWAQSPGKAVVLAVVIPALTVALVAVQEPIQPALLLLGLPAVLATGIELAVRRRRVAHGLPAIEAVTPLAPKVPVRPPASISARVGRGCLVLLGLGALFLAFFVWTLNTPPRHARAFLADLRPGMTVADVVIAAWPHGPYFVSAETAAEGAPAFSTRVGEARVGSELASGASSVRLLLDRHGAVLRVRSLRFIFTTLIPARSGIVVHFGPDGRVTSIEGPINWLD